MSESKCRNCGGDYGIHHYKTMQCPTHGREAPVGKKQEYKTSTFEPSILYDDLKNSHDALLEACKKGQAQLESTIIPMGARKPGTPIFRTIQELKAAIELAEKE